MNTIRMSALSLALSALVACAPSTESAPVTPAAGDDAAAATPGAPADQPADVFMAALASHCGQAFAGRIVANEPASGQPDAFEGQALLAARLAQQ